MDETGLLLAPLVRRSYAPRGKTPILRQRGRHRDKVSVIGGLVLSPKRRRPRLVFETLPNGYYDAPLVADFLRRLLRQIKGPLVVVWDNGNMHKGPAIRALPARHPRLTLEPLPTYAPMLNPAEAVWNHLKYTALANFTPNPLGEIERAATAVLQSAAADPARLRSFYNAVPYLKNDPAHATN
ncbi:MAG: IS630 family transposase [Planctomycetia bacterium]